MSGFIRINKFLASAGLGSRRGVEKAVTEGRVSVNGDTVLDLSTRVNPECDQIRFDGELVKLACKQLYLFHKPTGVISTLSDPQGRDCISDYINHLDCRLVPIGRLDYDVSGLILLCNDGDFVNSYLHPRYKIPRTYLARVHPPPTKALLNKLQQGLDLEDGYGKALSASILEAKEGREATVELSVGEGRNHFVKRLLAAAGHPVLSLARIGFGSYQLGNLSPGSLKKVKSFS